ncbi:MAG: hypothetical protein AAF456_04310 [Planctomycetota bacterium]
MRCWNCGTSRRGDPDPYFPDTAASRTGPGIGRLTRSRIVLALLVWFCFSCLVVTTVMWVTELMPVNIVNVMIGITVVFISGILTGVTVNVMGELGTVLQKHFGDKDYSTLPVMQLRRDRQQSTNENPEIQFGPANDD